MTLRTALSQNVLIIDGAMGTMLQSSDVTMDAFQGLEGCNEILNVTRPDVVRPSLDVADALAGAPASDLPAMASAASSGAETLR